MTAELNGSITCFVQPVGAFDHPADFATHSINIRLTSRRPKAALQKIEITALVGLGDVL